MRVFESFSYNLNQIKFKQNKEFFDTLLKELGFEYSDINFIFNDDRTGDICKKAIKVAPEIEQYVRYYAESEIYPHSSPQYRISSFILNQNGKLERDIKKEHHNAFGKLLTKIPSSVNFPFMGVILDKVNWYKENEISAFTNDSDKNVFFYHRFNKYFSSSIRFFKEFDYGNKFNNIEVMIDRTNDEQSLREYPEGFKELTAQLGKPYHQRLECIFEKSEREALEKAKITIDDLKKKNDYSRYFERFGNRGFDLTDSVTPVSKYSPKSIFSKAAKSCGYKYVKCQNGCYTYKKINESNHSFIVEFMFRPFSLYVDASICVNGYNFSHTIYSDKQISAKDQDILSDYAKLTFEVAEKAEQDFSKALFDLYGKTPDWFE